MARISKDPAFKLKEDDVLTILDAKNFVGRAPGQVDDFINECVKPIIEANKNNLGLKVDINV